MAATVVPLVSQTMLETKITEITNIIGDKGIPYVVTAGSANAYTVTLTPAPAAYVDGMAIAVKINIANTGASTININGLGAKSIVKPNGTALVAGNLTANGVYTLRYNGTNFILQGSTPAGTATPADVLTGKTFDNDSGTTQTGSMANRGATIITPSTANQAILAGYHNGSGYCAGAATLKAENIKDGVKIFNVTGNMKGGLYKAIQRVTLYTPACTTYNSAGVTSNTPTTVPSSDWGNTIIAVDREFTSSSTGVCPQEYNTFSWDANTGNIVCLTYRNPGSYTANVWVYTLNMDVAEILLAGYLTLKNTNDALMAIPSPYTMYNTLLYFNGCCPTDSINMVGRAELDRNVVVNNHYVRARGWNVSGTGTAIQIAYTLIGLKNL